MLKKGHLAGRRSIKGAAVAVCAAIEITLSAAMAAPGKAPQPDLARAASGPGAIRLALPAEPLAETLLAISQRSGQPVEFNPSDLVGIRAPPIRGIYTPVAALQKSFAGTKVTMAAAPGGGWVVFVPGALRTIVVTATRSEADTSFQATRSDTATRSDANLMDVPESITAITSAALRSQQALDIQDVLSDVSGVQTSPESQGPPGVDIRGFPETSLTNGLTDAFATDANIAGVERIEVLRGPQAVLSGSDTLGGVVNVVTKKPTATPIANLTLQYGTFADKTVTGRLSDGLAARGRLSGQLIASWTRASTSAAGFDGRRATYVTPQLRWKDDRTDFILGVSYDDEFNPLPQFTFALTGVIAPVPAATLGNPSDGLEMKTQSVFYSLKHRFMPWLSLVSRFTRSTVNQDLAIWAPAFPLDTSSTQNLTLAFQPTNSTTRYGQTSTDNYLRFTFRTGPAQHVLAAGVNTSLLNYTQNEYSPPNFSFVTVQPYVAQQTVYPPVVRNAASLFSISDVRAFQYGAYLQDLITVGDFHVSLNVRRSHYQDGPDVNTFPASGSSGFGPNAISTQPEQTFNNTSPMLGLVYNLTPDVSLYGQYGTGFAENYATQICGQVIRTEVPPPQSTKNQELGVKVSLPNGLFSFTTDVFSLTQTNILQYNQVQNCSSLIPGQRTRGLEFDAQGQLTKGWNLLANFSDSSYTYTDPSFNFLLPGLPRYQLSLWTTYAFQDRLLHGFGLGGGVTAYSRTYTFYQTGYPREPGAARVDMSGFYHRRHWTLILGVKNILNRTLYLVTPTPIGVPVADGRTVTFTVRYSFL